jgi:hypothetical protein
MWRAIAEGVEITCRFAVDGALANVVFESTEGGLSRPWNLMLGVCA